MSFSRPDFAFRERGLSGLSSSAAFGEGFGLANIADDVAARANAPTGGTRPHSPSHVDVGTVTTAVALNLALGADEVA